MRHFLSILIPTSQCAVLAASDQDRPDDLATLGASACEVNSIPVLQLPHHRDVLYVTGWIAVL
jgi:hypothetical protein